jgi:hypothetical protein
VVTAGWVVKRRGAPFVVRTASARSIVVAKRVLVFRSVESRARYSREGGSEGLGMPGSGAITGRSLVGAADVAGPTGVVGCGAVVGAARYGVAAAGAAVRPTGNGVASV